MIDAKAKNNHIRDGYQKRQHVGWKKSLIVKEIDHLIKTVLYLVKTNQSYAYELARQK